MVKWLQCPYQCCAFSVHTNAASSVSIPMLLLQCPYQWCVFSVHTNAASSVSAPMLRLQCPYHCSSFCVRTIAAAAVSSPLQQLQCQHHCSSYSARTIAAASVSGISSLLTSSIDAHKTLLFYDHWKWLRNLWTYWMERALCLKSSANSLRIWRNEEQVPRAI